MHIVTITKKNDLGIPFGEFLAEDVNSGEMLSRGWCTVREPDARCAAIPIYYHEDFNGKKLLFVRPGGYGDLLFITPTAAEIKRRWPKCEIWIACFKRFHEVLLDNPDIDGFIDYPVAIEKWSEFDSQVWLENIIEENDEARKTHAVDLVWQRTAGDELGELENKRMRYYVTEEERVAAEKEFPRSELARVGLQMGGSHGNLLRMYPKMGDVSQKLWRDGHEVFLLGRPGDMESNEPEGLINLMQRGKKFREQCAILSTCDVVVAPDSIMTHIAGALEISCVALYGPFPWKLRTAYAEKTFALQGMCPVSPCFHHIRPGTGIFPEHGPCYKSGKCEALDAISVDRVVKEVEKRLTKRVRCGNLSGDLHDQTQVQIPATA